MARRIPDARVVTRTEMVKNSLMSCFLTDRGSPLDPLGDVTAPPEGAHDEHDNHAVDPEDECGGDLKFALHLDAAGQHLPEQERGRHRGEGVQAAEQRRNDAVESGVLRECGGAAFTDQAVRLATEHEDCACDAGTCPTDGEGADDAALHGETGVPCRIGVVAHRPKPHAGNTAEEEVVAKHRNADRDHYTEMEPSPTRQQREVSVLAEPRCRF